MENEDGILKMKDGQSWPFSQVLLFCSQRIQKYGLWE